MFLACLLRGLLGLAVFKAELDLRLFEGDAFKLLELSFANDEQIFTRLAFFSEHLPPNARLLFQAVMQFLNDLLSNFGKQRDRLKETHDLVVLHLLVLLDNLAVGLLFNGCKQACF